LRFPETAWKENVEPLTHRREDSNPFPLKGNWLPVSRSLKFLLAARWWLAFFQGLTQAVLFKYAFDHLKISLTTYIIFTSLMIFLQMPMAWWAGRRCDAFREKSTLFWGMLVVSFAM